MEVTQDGGGVRWKQISWSKREDELVFMTQHNCLKLVLLVCLEPVTLRFNNLMTVLRFYFSVFSILLSFSFD